MRPIMIIILAFSTISCHKTPKAGPSIPAYTISGRVYDYTLKQPFANVKVWLHSERQTNTSNNSKTWAEARTDSAGRYTLTYNSISEKTDRFYLTFFAYNNKLDYSDIDIPKNQSITQDVNYFVGGYININLNPLKPLAAGDTLFMQVSDPIKLYKISETKSGFYTKFFNPSSNAVWVFWGRSMKELNEAKNAKIETHHPRAKVFGLLPPDKPIPEVTIDY